MKIGFDLTGLITGSRHRGIGVYLFNLLKNIDILAIKHEVIFIYPEIDLKATLELKNKLSLLKYKFSLLPYYLFRSDKYDSHLGNLNAKLFDSFVSSLGVDILHRST